VGLVTDLSLAEKDAAASLLSTFGSLGASEAPRGENDAWRMKVAGTGNVMDGGGARRAIEAFAERLDARLAPNRELWQSAVVVVGKLSATKGADAGPPELVVEKVLKNRSGETLAADDRMQLDVSDLPKESVVVLLSTFERAAGTQLVGRVFRVLPISAEKATTAMLEEQKLHSLSGK
jgi:hypothetical protein